MDTFVELVVVHRDRDDDCEPAMRRAFDRFAEVEARCSRFDRASELSRLSATVGEPVAVSDLLYSAISFACEVALATEGAFDPTVGRAMERNGFNQNYRTGERIIHGGPAAAGSYRDIELGPSDRTILLACPVVLDLGAVAKGLAIDLAAQELSAYEGFGINAGGDVFVHGLNAEGQPWLIGVRDARQSNRHYEFVELSDAAVCTSGDYERPGIDGRHHLVHAADGKPAASAISATVIAPTAMQADAFATAAFILGPHEGLRFLERQHVQGSIVAASLSRSATSGWSSSGPPESASPRLSSSQQPLSAPSSAQDAVR